MMLDDDMVAVSPSTTYRVLKAAGRLDRRSWAPSKKGTGFVQPDGPHRHWHTDISYINLGVSPITTIRVFTRPSGMWLRLIGCTASTKRFSQSATASSKKHAYADNTSVRPSERLPDEHSFVTTQSDLGGG
jgi:hypothetical protein